MKDRTNEVAVALKALTFDEMIDFAHMLADTLSDRESDGESAGGAHTVALALSGCAETILDEAAAG